MESKILELIQNLTNINSPSGNAYKAISYSKTKSRTFRIFNSINK